MNNIENLSLDSFSPICILGKGSFAHVLLVEAVGASCHNETTKTFALKMLDKTDIEFSNSSSTVYKEKEILLRLQDCDFVTRLQACFQGEQEISFLLDFCPGGDLFERMASNGPFREEQVRFYIGQIALALEQIHSRGVVFRDLKPENLLFDKEGYLTLADFGCSEIKIKGISGKVGTPEYMAPEMLSESDPSTYDYRVDWWALGCLMFEMLTGKVPFAKKNRKKLYKSIQTEQPKFNSISEEAQDLILSLLQKNPDDRFEFKQIKEHLFFKNFDWEGVIKKNVRAPWIPETTIDYGINNFNRKFVEMDFDGINCGMSEGLWLDDFYYESPAVKFIPRIQNEPREMEKEVMSYEDTNDEEMGRCGSFSDFDDDFDWSGDEGDSVWD
jgi:serine/threonine protein kinase